MAERDLRPTTTTYALLGLLSLRSWSGYELTVQARRSLHQVWTRSEANLYAEHKRLVRLGWATAREDHVGNRPRMVYSITPAGRRALRAWLQTEPAPPTLEVEALVRILFADQGGVDDLQRSLLATAHHARRELQAGRAIVREYLEGRGPFPERGHLVALVGEFLGEMYALIEDYATRTAALVGAWSDTRRTALDEGARQAFAHFEERHGQAT